MHEIPVGPIHAGTIEPGHFRFSIIGDRVLKLEERLGYTHKGMEKRFEGMDLATGARLAGRVSRRLPQRLRLGLLHGGGDGHRQRGARARASGCARCSWKSSASPTIWATSAISATTSPCLSASCSSGG